ncbi:MAG TPA: ParB/RepB/Spo0J family partition protein [Oligoflexia bacterium]|nr:ParB/RepB/Spo0J family partition protein [Oligoflexia bacterium]HMP48931.1 ParB/RepB/Spo0J family partition protein [Oligoflexia bacterium]
MSSKPGSIPPYKQKNVSLVARAIEEFNKVSSKQDETLVAQDTPVRKGANPGGKRTALGRGLSALLSPTIVENKKTDDLFGKNETADTSSYPDIHKADIHKEVAVANLSASSIEFGSGGPKDNNLIRGRFHLALNNSVAKGAPSVKKEPFLVPASHIPETKISAKKPGGEKQDAGLKMIPIDRLTPNPKQPRKEFSSKEIRELATSIRKSGLIQPILVRKSDIVPISQSLQEYEIVAGERRWRAAKEAGLIEIPAIIRALSDRETLELGIVENIQRQDLNPIEEANAYKSLIDNFGASQEDIASVVGKDRSSIANSIRLLNLPASVREMLSTRKLSPGHARAILSLEDPLAQEALAKELLENKLSVREAEKRASEKKKKRNPEGSKNQDTDSPSMNMNLEERLRRALGTKVKVSMSASGKGEVRISFFSRPEFEAFLEKLDA